MKFRLRGPLRDHTGVLGSLHYKHGVAEIPRLSEEQLKNLLTYHERCWQAEMYDDSKVQGGPERLRPVPEVHSEPVEEGRVGPEEATEDRGGDVDEEAGKAWVLPERERYRSKAKRKGVSSLKL